MNHLKPRPVFLTLWQIQLPLPGVVSILHRLSGVVMVLALPVVAIVVEQVLASPVGFAATAAFLTSWTGKLALLLMLWSLSHHLFAGLRHILLDVDIGLERDRARRSAQIVLIAAPILTVALVAAGLSA